MDEILKRLNQITNTAGPGPRERAAAGEMEPMDQRMRALTSDAFVERWLDLAGEILDEETEENFARGFRLGAQFMLLALAPVHTDPV